MNVRLMTVRLCAACALAGILAAPLAAQTTNNSNTTNTSTSGTQQVNDLVPVLVAFTGPQNWDYVGSAAGLGNGSNGGGNGTNGGGNGQWFPVAPMAAQWPAAPATWGTGTFAAVASSVPARAYAVAPDGATTSARPVWPNFAPIVSAQAAPDPSAPAVRLPPPIWKK